MTSEEHRFRAEAIHDPAAEEKTEQGTDHREVGHPDHQPVSVKEDFLFDQAKKHLAVRREERQKKQIAAKRGKAVETYDLAEGGHHAALVRDGSFHLRDPPVKDQPPYLSRHHDREDDLKGRHGRVFRQQKTTASRKNNPHASPGYAESGEETPPCFRRHDRAEQRKPSRREQRDPRREDRSAPANQLGPHPGPKGSGPRDRRKSHHREHQARHPYELLAASIRPPRGRKQEYRLHERKDREIHQYAGAAHAECGEIQQHKVAFKSLSPECAETLGQNNRAHRTGARTFIERDVGFQGFSCVEGCVARNRLRSQASVTGES